MNLLEFELDFVGGRFSGALQPVCSADELAKPVRSCRELCSVLAGAGGDGPTFIQAHPPAEGNQRE